MKKSSLTILLIILTASTALFSSCSDSDSFVCPSYNSAPRIPSKPSPADSAFNIPMNVTLSWTCTDPDEGDVLRFDVLVGKENPPEKVWIEGTSRNSLELGLRSPDTIWYWQVIATDKFNVVTVGPVWCFMTNKSVLTEKETD